MLRFMLAKRNTGDEGATAVEYGLMVALIAVAIIVAVTGVGKALGLKFDDIASHLQ